MENFGFCVNKILNRNIKHQNIISPVTFSCIWPLLLTLCFWLHHESLWQENCSNNKCVCVLMCLYFSKNWTHMLTLVGGSTATEACDCRTLGHLCMSLLYLQLLHSWRTTLPPFCLTALHSETHTQHALLLPPLTVIIAGDRWACCWRPSQACWSLLPLQQSYVVLWYCQGLIVLNAHNTVHF